MKICILSIVNIKHMPLISLYSSFFDTNHIKYDIIYIDKYNEEEKIAAENIYRYPIEVNRDWNKIRKFLSYYGFKKYAISIIKKNLYDFIIVWKTETALMFSDFLTNYSNCKYCINIRDYCQERNPFIFLKIRELVYKSNFTTISSEGFKKFLPQYGYLTIHSFNKDVLESCALKGNHDISLPVHICFIGSIRFIDYCKRIIDAFKNDQRYILQFFGENSDILKQYSKEKGITNVETYGGFRVEETPQLLNKADVINNLFGNGNPALDTLLSIRLYYAIYLRMPIIVNTGTYMQQISEKCGIGFTVDDNSLNDIGDKFYAWLKTLDHNNINALCSKFISEIEEKNKEFEKVLRKTFI
jgi:hypothetical protein